MPSFLSIQDLRVDLQGVEAALKATRSGQSYSIGGRTLTRQDVDVLLAERTRLRREIKRAQAYEAGVQAPTAAVATWNP